MKNNKKSETNGKRFIRLFLPMLFLTVFFFENKLLSQELSLKIKILNVIPDKGTVNIALFDSTGFRQKSNPVVSKTVAAGNDSIVIVTMNKIPAGRYSIAVFQDTNSNNQLDRMAFGIPAEPFGFSNNPDSKRPPKFDDAAILTEKTGEVTIKLNRFKSKSPKKKNP